MGLIQTSAPYAEPLDIDEVKEYLRIDLSNEDALIDALIIAARERAELFTQRQFITAGYKLTTNVIDCEHRIKLPKPPLQSVTQVKAYDAAGELYTVNPETYRVITDDTPGYIQFITLPEFDCSRPDAIQVEFTAGYGFQEHVPAGIKIAMKWIIADAYANREGGQETAVDRLLTIYKVY